MKTDAYLIRWIRGGLNTNLYISLSLKVKPIRNVQVTLKVTAYSSGW